MTQESQPKCGLVGFRAPLRPGHEVEPNSDIVPAVANGGPAVLRITRLAG